MEDPLPELSELAGPLTAMIVLPYLGADAARAEITRAAPKQTVAPAASPPSTASSSSQRLTLRTLGVLRAISERPGLSNAQLARATAIEDPSQVSRLLSRLRSRGLVESEPPSGGGSVGKAWRLSAQGRALLAETRRVS
jgi:DNA-binding MarR family transcriptional regulator